MFLDRLVEELTPDRVPNARLLNVTLLTFRCAFKAKELYSSLCDRWSVPAPPTPSTDQWKATRQAIRLRVLNVFKVHASHSTIPAVYFILLFFVRKRQTKKHKI